MLFPDPISEAQKKEYASLKDYIQAVIVPDMQKKLRQGFGRALRTETDTCVVSILDERAGEGGRYHEGSNVCASELQDGKKTSRMSSTLFETGRRGILPVTVRGSATEKQILHEKFGGISRAFSVGLLVLMNSYFGMKWVYCV